MEARATEAPEAPAEAVPRITGGWCACGKCRQMPTEVETQLVFGALLLMSRSSQRSAEQKAYSYHFIELLELRRLWHSSVVWRRVCGVFAMPYSRERGPGNRYETRLVTVCGYDTNIPTLVQRVSVPGCQPCGQPLPALHTAVTPSCPSPLEGDQQAGCGRSASNADSGDLIFHQCTLG
ncbi:unnamed protein product [Gadus morhua 'NCC']